MSDPSYEALAKAVIYAIQQTQGPIELDVTPVADPVLLKRTIQEKGFDVAEQAEPGRLLFIVSLPKRRFYPLINNHRQGS